MSNLYPPIDLGGYEQQCQEVADGLRKRGYQVLILTSNYGLNGSPLVEKDTLRQLHLQADPYYYSRKDFFLKRRQNEEENKQILRKTLQKYQPDLVIVWGMYLLSRNLPHWLEHWVPTKVAYFVSSYWPDDEDIHLHYWSRAKSNSLATVLHRAMGKVALNQLRRETYPPSLQFNKTVCSSQYVRKHLVDKGAVPENAGVLRLGIDPNPFLKESAGASSGQLPLKLVYFGSLLPHKGVHTAVEALSRLKEKNLAQRIHLTIIGSGPTEYETHLREVTRDLGISEQVIFTGRIPRPAIPSQLGRFDIFLFPSIWPEPFARTLIEAMAAGLAVIWSDVGGTREMFTHYPEDTSFSPGDAQALADHIHKFLDEPETLKRLGEAGRSFVLENLTLERMLDEMEHWFEEMMY